MAFNRSPDRAFRGIFNKVNYEIPPQTCRMLPRQAVMVWSGNPRYRDNPVEWFRELNRLKNMIGSGSSWFDYWLKGGMFVVPAHGNQAPNFYEIPGSEVTWNTDDCMPIPAEYLKMPEIPDESVTSFSFSEEEFDQIVRNTVGGNRLPELVGSADGPETSEESDISSSITVQSSVPSKVKSTRDRPFQSGKPRSAGISGATELERTFD